MNKNFYIIFSFIPIIFGLVFTFFIINFNIEIAEFLKADWFFLFQLNWIRLLIIVLSVLLAQYFLINKLGLNFQVKQIKGLKFNRKILFLLFGYFLGILTGLNWREFADQNGLNLIYTTSGYLFIFAFFSKIRLNILGIFSIILIGFFAGINGSKSSLINYVLFYITFFAEFNLLSLASTVLLIPLTILVNPFLVARYINVGISMITISSICENTKLSTFSIYIETILSKLSGGSLNPGKEFLLRSGIASGYNIAPTVIGDLYCFGDTFILGLIFYFLTVYIFYILPSLLFKYNYLDRALLAFTSISLISSSLFDQVKTSIIVNIAILLSKKFYSNFIINSNSKLV